MDAEPKTTLTALIVDALTSVRQGLHTESYSERMSCLRVAEGELKRALGRLTEIDDAVTTIRDAAEALR